MIEAKVISVSRGTQHNFSKAVASSITLIAGEGVEGDAHRGVTVKHRSRVNKDPTQPNLRQVHLIHNELIEMLKQRGFDVAPGVMGENITTSGLNILSLPVGTRLALGEAEIEITGLRNPCGQLDNYQRGLTAAVLDRDADGNLMRLAGIMAVVVRGGVVKMGDAILVKLPVEPYRALEPV